MDLSSKKTGNATLKSKIFELSNSTNAEVENAEKKVFTKKERFLVSFQVCLNRQNVFFWFGSLTVQRSTLVFSI